MIIKEIDQITLDMTQSFKYLPVNKGSVGSNEIIKYCNNKQIDHNIAAIAKYLYKFKCAPIDYLCRDLEIKDEKKYFGKMMYLVQKRVFNAFVLTDKNDEFTTKDAKVFFTLDYGAIFFLKAIDDNENIENWKATDMMMSGHKVKKCLMLIDFYRMIRKDCEYFHTYHLYVSYGARIRTKAVFKLKEGSELASKYPGVNLIEIVSKNDIIEESTTDMAEKLHSYEKFLCTDGWERNGYKEPPTLLIIGDSQASLKRIKDQISDLKIEKIKYTYF